MNQRLQLTTDRLVQTQNVVSAIKEQLVALSAPPLQTQKDNTTEGEKETQKKDQTVQGKVKELATTQGESSFSNLLEEEKCKDPRIAVIMKRKILMNSETDKKIRLEYRCLFI